MHRSVLLLALILTPFATLFADEGEKFKMSAFKKRLDLRKRSVILYGSVEVTYRELTFKSDGAVLFLDKKFDLSSIYAEGAVRITYRELVLEADAAFYDFEKESGTLVSACAYLKRKPSDREGMLKPLEEYEELLLRAKRIRTMRDFQRYIVEDGIVSTCTFYEPHWGVRFRRVEFTRDGRLKVVGNRLVIGPFRIPLPSVYIEREWWMPIRRVDVGSRTDFGTLFSATFRIWQSRTLKTDVRYERYSQRGEGVGFENRYRKKKHPSILLSGFYIYDKGEAVEEHARWRAAVDTDWRPHSRLFLSARYRRTSDAYMLRDYFEKLYRESVPQESYGLLRYWDGGVFAEALVLGKTEPFRTETEYLPSLSAELFNFSLHPVVVDGRVALEYIRRNYSEDLALLDDECRRTLVSGRVSLPFDSFVFRINPKVSASVTSYSRTHYAEEETSRSEASFSVSLSTLIWKRYGKTLHTIEPTISFFSRFHLSKEPSELDFYDETEQVERERFLELTLFNLVQTDGRRECDIRLGYRHDILNRNDTLYAEVTVEPFEWLKFYGRVDAQGEDLSLLKRQMSVGIRYRGWRASVEDYLLADEQHLLTVRVNASKERWSPTFFYQYDFTEDRSSKVGFILTRRLHCWIIEFGWEFDRVDDDRRVFFWLSPSAFYPEKRTELTTMELER